MINSILSDWFKLNVGDGAFYAIFGFLFVFAGIALLVVIFTVLGVIMKKMNARKPKKKKNQNKKGRARSNEKSKMRVFLPKWLRQSRRRLWRFMKAKTQNAIL